jgi:hypothetical protein
VSASRAAAAVLLAAGALLGSACSERSDALGAGEDIDGCVAYAILEFFEEPSPEDPQEVKEYADATLRVLDRIRPDFKIQRSGDRPDIALPKEVVDDYGTMERSMKAFKEALEAAGSDKAQVRAAKNALAADDGYLAADARVGEFWAKECPRD